MSKVSGKRQTKRRQELMDLSVLNPRQFREKWATRVATWSGQIAKWIRAGRLDRAEMAIQHGLQELTCCGDAAWKLVATETRDLLLRARNGELDRMAQESPAQLRSLWGGRILRLRKTVRGCVNDGLGSLASSALVSQLKRELQTYSDRTREQIGGEDTEMELEAEHTVVVAQQIDRKMCHLSNTGSNYEQYSSGRHRLPTR